MLLSGHDHNYERLVPLDAAGAASDTGIVQFVVGTGGKGLRSVNSAANSAASNRTTLGHLEVTLAAGSYSWEFVPAAFAGKGSFTDSGTRDCN